MGRQAALTLAREGANVALNYGTYRKTRQVAEQTARAIRKEFDAKAVLLPGDTTKAQVCKQLVARTVKAFGSIDILVVNTGSPWEFTALEKVKDSEWSKSMAAEINNAWFLTKYAVQHMEKRSYGRVFLLGMYRAQAWRGPPFDGTFGKAARALLTEKLALSLNERGITVNTIAPGYIEGLTYREAVATAKGGPPPPHGQERPTPQHAAEAIVWLCREEARWVSGAEVPVWGRGPPQGKTL
jgi:NAD(P)-dependent dehydrogenase (short-subunit alcohol dehydrogenase family)